MDFDTGKWTVKTILSMIGGRELILQPDYQRFYIWDLKKEQGLIDSILRGFPIPPVWIWTHEDASGDTVFEVIDGQQRLTCIRRYLNNEFSFKEIAGTPSEVDISDADGKYHDAVPAGQSGDVLSSGYRSRLKAYTIPYVEVKTDDRSQIIDIFKRLNKSATNLNPQEMRNAFYTGDFKSCVYEVTAKLQDDSYWGRGDRVFSKPTTDRMANQQFVSDLIVAMIRGEVQHQSSALDEFYEVYDQGFNDRKQLESRFEKAAKRIKKIFPDSSRFTKNLSDFYTLFLYIDELDVSKDVRFDDGNLSAIGSALRRFELDYASYSERRSGEQSDSSVFERYRETIVGRQREKEVREARRSILHELIDPGLKITNRDPQRLFSDEQKHYIWQVSIDKRCGICSNVVDSWDEYEPDHILSWVQGGRTSIDNGQVSHKSCNRAKRDS